MVSEGVYDAAAILTLGGRVYFWKKTNIFAKHAKDACQNNPGIVDIAIIHSFSIQRQK